MYIILHFLILLLVIFYYFTYDLNYWKVRNVPYEKGKIIVGNLGSALLMKKTAAEIYKDIYRKFSNYKYCGFFQFGRPALLVSHPDVIKDVFVKNFNNFHDVPFIIDEKQDPILSKNPFFTKGEKWKLIRTLLTPQFTSGKMKGMFPLIKEVGNRLIDYLHREDSVASENGINAKDLAGRFTADAVANCAFGMNGRSFVDSKPEFLEMGKQITIPTYFGIFTFMMISMFPGFAKIKIPTYLRGDISEKFKNIILANLKQRELDNIKRGDFLDAISEMRKTTTSFDYNTDYMVSSALTFFLDGFETSSIVLQYVYYELGANQDVQRKLRTEIEKVLLGDFENLTYDNLQEMKYLDMVLKETLRRYPPLTAATRECTETMTFDPAGPGCSALLVEKGSFVVIPVLAIHYDPKYYPNPEEFNPDRFNEESKASIPKYAYLAFGEGHRMCLGRRFAITQIKVAVVATILNFEIRVNKKTKEPLELDPTEFLHGVKGGVHVNFYKLKK